MNLLFLFYTLKLHQWPIGQVVKTAASHAVNIGSNPVWVTRVVTATAAQYNIVRVDCHEGPPVPIPNTEVKLMYADNTWRATAWEDR